MIKRKKENEDLPNNLHISGKKKNVVYYYYINPITKKNSPMGCNRKTAIEAAQYLNSLLTKKASLVQAVINPKNKTVLQVVNDYKNNEVPNKPWAKGTADNYRYRYNKFAKDLGHHMIEVVDRLMIAKWLENFASSNDVYNTTLFIVKDIYDYAISRKYLNTNEAAAVRRKSLSKKLEVNKKSRKRLTVEMFWAIHEKAPNWLKNAMELSLITLQARHEIINMQYTHYRNGWLYVVRQKVAGESDFGFIRIKSTDQIDAIIKRTRNQIASPYIVHYNPKRMRRDQIKNKNHWSCITPGYLSNQFKVAREKTGLFDEWPLKEKPSFHEIRSLGARIYREQGVTKQCIKSLLTHSDKRTTQVYLDGGDLTDEQFYKVEAGLDLNNLPAI